MAARAGEEGVSRRARLARMLATRSDTLTLLSATPHHGSALHRNVVVTKPGPKGPCTLRRTFGLDVLACPRCGGRLQLIALIEHARVVERILRHPGLPTDRPEPRPRAPPDAVLDPEPQLIPGFDATF